MYVSVSCQQRIVLCNLFGLKPGLLRLCLIVQQASKHMNDQVNANHLLDPNAKRGGLAANPRINAGFQIHIAKQAKA